MTSKINEMVSIKSIKCVDTGLVYRNPKPHLRAVHAWHPTLNVNQDGDLIATFDLAEAVESLDYATYISRSSDGGKSWDQPQRLIADELLRHPSRRTVHSIRPTILSNGLFVAIVVRLYRDDLEEGFWNRQTMGLVEMDLLWARSQDEGRTWQPLELLQPPVAGPCWEICHRPVELPDGRLLQPVANLRNWEGQLPDGSKALALVVEDDGRTCSQYFTLLDDHANGIIHLEQSLVPLADGRLLSVAWAFDETSGTTKAINYAVGDGQHFTAPRPTGLSGETAKMVALADGGVICAYRGIEPSGLCVVAADLDGDQWRHGDPIVAWQGSTITQMFGDRSAADELAALKLGHPSLVVLPDGDVLVAFWCCEDEVYNIRWVRIAVD